MATANVVRGLWLARCLLCTAKLTQIPIALHDATSWVVKISGLPPHPQDLLDLLAVGSELDASEWYERTGSIDELLAGLQVGAVGVFLFEKDVLCVGNLPELCFIADPVNGLWEQLSSASGAISEEGERVRCFFVKLKKQRLDRRRPLKKRKI